MAVEIEMRARFTKETHDQLVTRLKTDGEDLGTDDKHIYFYVLPDQLLKVTDNTAAGTAKITLKGSKIGQGAAFAETEFAIAPPPTFPPRCRYSTPSGSTRPCTRRSTSVTTSASMTSKSRSSGARRGATTPSSRSCWKTGPRTPPAPSRGQDHRRR